MPEEPTVSIEITASDRDAEKRVEVELTPTENLVTKMKVTCRISWAPGPTDRPKDKSEKTMIIRHNVTRYGIQEEEKDWYIYNQPDTIYRCTTLSLVCESNTLAICVPSPSAAWQPPCRRSLAAHGNERRRS